MPDGKQNPDRIKSTCKKTRKSGGNSVICILGMHRSGTSCLAGCLEELGLHLGDVVNSAPFNPKGNKENLTLRAINDDVLSLSGGSWDRPPARLVWNDTLRRRRDDHISNHSAYKNWGFKDPRTVLTLPFWLEANLNMKFVGSFRHPWVVSQSLKSRKGLEPMLSPLKLWKHYNLKLLEYVAEFKFPLICFDSPVQTYIRGLGKVVHIIGLNNDRDVTIQFFDESLRSRDIAKSDFEDAESASIYNKLLSFSVNAN